LQNEVVRELELNRCIGMPIYIGGYDEVADVSYWLYILAIFAHKSCYPVLHYCSAWNFPKPNLPLRL